MFRIAVDQKADTPRNPRVSWADRPASPMVLPRSTASRTGVWQMQAFRLYRALQLSRGCQQPAPGTCEHTRKHSTEIPLQLSNPSHVRSNRVSGRPERTLKIAERRFAGSG